MNRYPAVLPQAKPVIAQTQVVSIQRVSVPSFESDSACAYPSISADGRYVAFQSAASNLVIRTNPPASVQADGELVGMTPISVTVLPQSVNVIVPQPVNWKIELPINRTGQNKD